MDSATNRSEASCAVGRLSACEVRDMFASLAPRYDLLNHVLSIGLDVRWRRSLAGRLPRGEALRVVDLCTGTGDLAAALARRLGPSAEVVGVDFCEPMLHRAREKYGGLPGLQFLCGDATRMPLESGAWDAVTVAFGVRNLSRLPEGLGEMLRLLRPGGRALILDFCRPRGWLWPRIFGFYFRRVLPIVGRVVSGHRGAYTYLPASVARFAEPEGIAEQLRSMGAEDTAVQRLTGGVAALVSARKRV